MINVKYVKHSLSRRDVSQDYHNILYLKFVPALSFAHTDSTFSKISFNSGFPGTFTLQIQLILLTCFLNKIVSALQDYFRAGLTSVSLSMKDEESFTFLIAWAPRPNFIFIPKTLHLLRTPPLGYVHFSLCSRDRCLHFLEVRNDRMITTSECQVLACLCCWSSGRPDQSGETRTKSALWSFI